MSYLASLREHLYTLASVQTTFQDELVPARLSIGVMKRDTLAGQATLATYWLETEEKFQADLKYNLQMIRELFRKACSKIESNNVLFFSCFRSQLMAESFNPEQQEKAERKILAVCANLNPFIKQLLKGLELPYLDFLKEGIDSDKLMGSFRLAKLVQKIKNLELTTGGQVPLALFCKLINNQRLKDKEEKELRTWLQVVSDASTTYVPTFKGDKKNPYVKVHYLHRLFKALSQIVPEFDCVKLEIKLEAFGCSLFQQADPFWISFRKKINADTTVLIKDTTYQLAECLSNQDNDPELPMVFAVSGDDFHAIIIDKNEAERGIRQYWHDKMQYGLIQPLEIGFDTTGAISLIERCQERVCDIDWVSEDDKLADKDVSQAAPIVALIHHMAVKQPFTPCPLSPQFLGFNQDGEMRALCPLEKSQKSYEALEIFAWNCAQNEEQQVNVPVFNYLLQAGGVDTSRYKHLLTWILEDKEMNLCVSSNGEIERPDVLETRQKFYDEVKAIQVFLIQEIASTYQIDDQSKFKKDLNLAIIETHHTFCPGFLLLEDFSLRCKARYLLAHRPRMIVNKLIPIREGIISKIAQTDLKNKRINALWREEKTYFYYGIYNLRQQLDIFQSGENAYKLINKS